MTTHLVIPDTQVKPGVPTDHLRWIGQYIIDKKPDVIVHLGDHWDMPSLSSYDKGKKAMEGRRYTEDIKAGNAALRLLDSPTNRYNAQRAHHGRSLYEPTKILLRGNHEHRVIRAIESDAVLDGTIGPDDFESPGWDVHEFLEVVWVDGIAYSHYFANPMSGRPYGGQCATRLKTLGCSFTMGHQQVLDYAMRSVAGGTQMHHGLIAGTCYIHDEDYLGPQGNLQWRGIVMKHEVSEGHYDIMLVSLEYLCRRYVGTDLTTFLKESM